MSEHTHVSGPRSAFNNMLSTPALRFRGFRLLWLSTAFSSWGFVGEMVILGWMTQVLTEDTFKVGVVLGVRMVPFLLLGVPAGAVADRFDRRQASWALVNIGMAAAERWLSVLLIMWDIVGRLASGGFRLCRRLPAGREPCLRARAWPTTLWEVSNVINGLALMSMGMRVGAIAGSLSAGSLMERRGR